VYNSIHFQPTTVFHFPRALHSSFAKSVAEVRITLKMAHRVYLGDLSLSIDRIAKGRWRWNTLLIEQCTSARASLRLAPCAKATMSLRPYRYILESFSIDNRQQQHLLVFATSGIGRVDRCLDCDISVHLPDYSIAQRVMYKMQHLSLSLLEYHTQQHLLPSP
jgi:hypothetical protein